MKAGHGAAAGLLASQDWQASCHYRQCWGWGSSSLAWHGEKGVVGVASLQQEQCWAVGAGTLRLPQGQLQQLCFCCMLSPDLSAASSWETSQYWLGYTACMMKALMCVFKRVQWHRFKTAQGLMSWPNLLRLHFASSHTCCYDLRQRKLLWSKKAVWAFADARLIMRSSRQQQTPLHWFVTGSNLLLRYRLTAYDSQHN